MAGNQFQRIAQARSQFFDRDRLPGGDCLPETILQSWQRCRRMGLPAERPPAIEPVPQPRLLEMRQRNEALLRAARPELDALAGDAKATGSIVLLTDAEGWILDAVGNPQFLDRAGRVALMPGACWGENLTGTNAIGTAIAAGEAVRVHGGQHYLAPNHILSCTAAPIHDPYGALAGVLDLSGDAQIEHVHALALVRLAVAQIEHRYFEAAAPGCQVLRMHYNPALLGSAQEALLAFRGQRLVAANSVALRLFGLDRRQLGRARYQELFDEPIDALQRQGVLHDRHGQAMHGKLTREDAPVRTGTRLGAAAPAPAEAPEPAPVLIEAPLAAQLAASLRVLEAGLPVLIQGETGTGKEIYARELHRRSRRAGRAFVAVNCAALPEGLIEAELFGYEDGAYTGARRQGSPGLLRQADGGVLFLDEIGDMPLALQPRLLRVLQERELTPLGGGKSVRLDFALVCATHRDLPQLVREGRFRADLYYRIAHHTARLPALAEHPDRRGLVQTLWARMAEARRLEPTALDRLADYPWPGNYRQLIACLATLVALTDVGQPVGLSLLPEYLNEMAAAPAAAPTDSGLLSDREEALMRDALQACGGNVSLAARRLGISRSTLYRRVGKGK
ncbi:MAG: sigma-54-dependent Fis family transcriptional regulator [Lysobacterales bacterium]